MIVDGNGWSERLLSDCVTPFEVDRAKKVLARDYKPEGRFPVVDQSQHLIAGYSDDEAAVVMDKLPVVVFGDHTRVFKFVDFPFVVGADGTKLLKTKSELDARFFYFACLALDIPTRGYNRHFKILREQVIRYPTKPEQEKIAAVLWKIQKAVEIEDALVRDARDLKKSLLRRLFTCGLRGEPLKETETGPLPQSWEVELLSDCAHVQTGVAKGRQIYGLDMIEVPYLRVANVQHGHLDLTEIKKIQIRRDELSRYSLRKDDIVVTEGGDFDKLGRGFIWDGQVDPCVHQNHIFAIRPNHPRLLPRYLAYLIQSPHGRDYFLTVAHKTTNLACINTSKLKALPVLIPPLNEQEEIAYILQTADGKIDIHESKKGSLQELFKTMLHKFMTAQIRLNDLDINRSEVDGTHGIRS